MLVFKDTLLSFTAGRQLSSNDMLRVGDWIEMPQMGAAAPANLRRLTSIGTFHAYVQGDLFGHPIAVLPEFGLRLYQSPTGHDIRAACGSWPCNENHSYSRLPIGIFMQFYR